MCEFMYIMLYEIEYGDNWVSYYVMLLWSIHVDVCDLDEASEVNGFLKDLKRRWNEN